MNGKAARLIRKFVNWAGVKSQTEVRARKRSWNALSHRQKGKTRARIETVMAQAKPPAGPRGALL